MIKRLLSDNSKSSLKKSDVFRVTNKLLRLMKDKTRAPKKFESSSVTGKLARLERTLALVQLIARNPSKDQSNPSSCPERRTKS